MANGNSSNWPLALMTLEYFLLSIFLIKEVQVRLELSKKAFLLDLETSNSLLNAS